MKKFFLKKSLYTLIFFIAIVLITFIAIDQIKGDPVSSMHGPHIPSEKQREIKKEELGVELNFNNANNRSLYQVRFWKVFLQRTNPSFFIILGRF